MKIRKEINKKSETKAKIEKTNNHKFNFYFFYYSVSIVY